MRTSILQIVPRFKPSLDGLGDYSRILGAELYSRHQIRSHFLIFRPGKSPLDPAEIAPNTASYVPNAGNLDLPPAPAALAAAAEMLAAQGAYRCALMHYTPYAYTPKGPTARLPDALQSLAGRLPLWTFFHETWYTGLPWKRAFWTQTEQRSTMRRLEAMSQLAITSNAKYAADLTDVTLSDNRLLQIPIFSNMGEPSTPPLAARKRQLILFGQLQTRVRLYKQQAKLASLCQDLRLEKIIDVGSGNHPDIPASIAGIPVERTGFLEDSAVSKLLAESVAGVVAYWPDLWEKSGVIAAYIAHGLVPVLIPIDRRRLPKPASAPYLELEDVARMRSPDGAVSDAALQQIVDASSAYYRAHHSMAHAVDTIAARILA